MKLPTQAELDGHQAATIRGAVEGTLASLAVAVPASYYLHRRWAYFRSLPLTIKTLGVVLVVGPVFAIQAERRGVQFDKAHWTGAAKLELDRERSREEQRWGSLNRWQKVGDWAERHQYSIIFGCWVASMAGSWLVLSRNKTQSFSQKLVQARVYAQGATVGTMLGAAILTQTQRREVLKQKGIDHSWASLLEEQEIEARGTALAV